MPLFSKAFFQNSATQVNLSNPNTSIIQGNSGGLTIVGGTAASNNLTLSSTSNATKGKMLFGTSAYDEVNNRLGIGGNTPTAPIDTVSSSGSDGVLLQRWQFTGAGNVYSLTLKQTVTFLNVRWVYDQVNFSTTYASVLAFNQGNVGMGISDPTARLHISAPALTGAVVTDFQVTAASNTALTASTERLTIDIGSGSQQWATGALTTQRFNLYRQPTINFVGSSTVTTAANVYISGAPIKGTSATITSSSALYIDSGSAAGATNTYNLFSIGGKINFRDNATPTSNFFAVQANSGAGYLTISSTGSLFTNVPLYCYGVNLYGGFDPDNDFLIAGTDNASRNGDVIIDSNLRVATGHTLKFSQAGNRLIFQPNAATTTYTLTWPGSQGAANSFLKNDGSGNLTWNAGVNVSRYPLIGFVNAVGGSSTKTAGIGDILNVSGIVMTNTGTVNALSVVMSTARTAGTMTGKWLKNGVVQSGTVVIDGTNTTQNSTTGLSVAYVSGDILSLQTVTASFTPTSADAGLNLWVQE